MSAFVVVRRDSRDGSVEEHDRWGTRAEAECERGELQANADAYGWSWVYDVHEVTR